jgi:RNA polymerase sigma-70 factor (ECF subfamily)
VGGTSFVMLCADEPAFRAWYDVALPRVFGFVHGRTGGDAVLAEEITAQAFLEAVRARATFDDRSDPITWICSIARNRLIDHYRRVSREQAGHLRLVVSNVDAERDREAAAWDAADRREEVLVSLRGLPALERTALLLRHLDGYSVGEVARLIGRSERSTESLLSRARERVRATISGDEP